jgi:hypothetical protein
VRFIGEASIVVGVDVGIVVSQMLYYIGVSNPIRPSFLWAELLLESQLKLQADWMSLH